MSNVIPSMIADAISTAVAIGANNATALFKPIHDCVYEDEKNRYFLTRLAPDVAAKVVTVDRARRSLRLRLDTLTAFAAFLAAPPEALGLVGAPVIRIEPEEAVVSWPAANPPAAPVTMPVSRVDAFLDDLPRPYRSDSLGKALVRVMPGQIAATYNIVGHEQRHEVYMPLAYSEAFLALKEIFDGVTQKRLWTLLATDLQGCFPEAYEMIISGLGHLEKNSHDVDIQRTGIANVSASRHLELIYRSATGEQARQIDIDWIYQGPVWNAFENLITIPCRLVISKEGSWLTFRLFPKSLEALLLDHRAALTSALNDELAAAGVAIPIYEGRA